ncbi:MAG: phospholipase D-like domain-containing protein [Chloroflexota bacterium]
MINRIATFFLAAVLPTMACASLPLTLPAASSASTDANATPNVTPTFTPALPQVESLTQIPLHAGYGLRGPWFEIYFTDPANPASAQMTGGVDSPLVESIDAARLSVHAAIYSLTLDTIREALIRAHRRGVEVRLVTESDNSDSEDLQRIKDAGIPILGDRRQGTMHNKFLVIDRTNVWTGSMNFTFSGAYPDNNTVMRIASADLAEAYETEFAEMFEDDKFGPEAGRPTPQPRLEIEGTLMEVYFAPDDGVEAALVDLLDTAQYRLDFLAYSFTSDPLGDAVMRAADAGVAVRGVMDEDQGASNIGSELTAFRSAGLNVRLDGNPGQMHEKVIIVDETVVVLGSYNFSRNANEINDENVLVIHSRLIASQYLREFERLYVIARP